MNRKTERMKREKNRGAEEVAYQKKKMKKKK